MGSSGFLQYGSSAWDGTISSSHSTLLKVAVRQETYNTEKLGGSRSIPFIDSYSSGSLFLFPSSFTTEN